MMEVIKIESNESGLWEKCCPHGKGSSVGSLACQVCKYFYSINEELQEVACKYKDSLIAERVTPTERARFHKILDESIDKMNSPKNAKKEHWSKIPLNTLQKMINVENAELELACVTREALIETENFDLINLNLMMVDNLRCNE